MRHVTNRSLTTLRLCTAILVLLASAARSYSVAANEKPNIVLIFIDDMGYGDIGPFGNKVNKTPSLDRMAREGNVLRQFYVANTACTPSRAALMTGTYAARIGMDGQVCFPGETRGLNPKEITIAEMLKDKGYATGCFGKWHLGDQPEFLPLKQGFDEYFGIPYSNDMWPGNTRGNPLTNRGPYTPLPVLRQNDVVSYVSDGVDQALLCEVVTDYAVKFIDAHKEEPFFCYVPHAYVHHPRFARPEILKKAGGDINRANVEEVDTSVGRILDKLRELNLDNKTLVIFTSDNGGASGMSMGPLRGGKGGLKYEGHMREPTITWWPETIPAGIESNGIAVTTDLLPSLARLTATKIPEDRTIDGKDVLDILLGKPNASSPHDIHYYEVDAIRRGPWKLIRKGNNVELYNLGEDLGERKNLAKQQPKIVVELRELLSAHAAAIASDTRPAGFVKPGTAKPLITEPGDLPKLRDYMGLAETTAIGPATKKASSAPKPRSVPKNQPKKTSGLNPNRQPNFVLILADDQGWNALSTSMDPDEPGSGSTYYRTPHLDRLAAQSMRFSQAYSPAPTCSPTRHAIQFGRSPASLKIFGADGIVDWDADSSESLANVLKSIDGDYVCAHLGKWHIGRSPQELGFDASDGSTGNKTGNSSDPDDPKLIYDLSQRSIEFMNNQVDAGSPFFLQISHYADHLKYQAKADTIRKYETELSENATPYQNSPLWAAMNENLDEGVGMVLDRIDELGIADNTYVFYTADNGYELKRDFGKPVHERGYYKAFPQRSHKYHVSEGGIRVPFIVRGPDIPAGSHSSVPVVGTDIFTTVMHLAGAAEQVPQRVEGASLAAHLHSGGSTAVKRRDPFLVFKHSKPRPPHDIAIVQGHYKLIKDINTGRVFLFDLKEDIGERHSLADREPDRAKQMYAAMTEYFSRFGWDESQVNTQTPRRPGKQPINQPRQKQ